MPDPLAMGWEFGVSGRRDSFIRGTEGREVELDKEVGEVGAENVSMGFC